MKTLSIDPSITTGTGLAVVHFDELQFCELPQLVASACIKPDAKITDVHEQARFISQVIHSWIETYSPDLVAIEAPPNRVKPIGYERQDGTRGTRILVSPGQHRLVGQIEGIALVHKLRTVYVTPAQVKIAVGLPGNSKIKPVEEVESIVGTKLSDTKYVREAVADAIAVAIAARDLLARQTA